MHHEAKLWIKLRDDAVNVLGAPEITTPHQMTCAALCDGLEGSGALHSMSPHCQLQLPPTRNAVEMLSVDADDESARCDVLIAKPCPLVGGRLGQLRDVAGKGIAGV